MRRTAKLYPNTADKFSEEAKWAKELLIERAETLSRSTNWRETALQFKQLSEEWKASTRGDRSVESQQFVRYTAAKDRFFDARKSEFERRDRDSAESARVKQRLISSAEGAASSSDIRAAGESMRKLTDEWKAAPRAKKEDEDKLWVRFNVAKTRLNSRRDEERKKREGDEAQAKSAKQSIVHTAKSVSHSSDLRAAKEEMRRLQDRWKTLGRASRADDDALYRDFKSAQDALFQRSKAEGAKREEEQKAALRAKEYIISQIKGLASCCDLKVATDQVKALSDQYFAAGSAGRENERLKASFQSAKGAFFDAKERESERKKAEWEANKRTRIAEMEQRVREMESRVSQAAYQLSTAWSQLSETRSRPQPSWTNPHRSDIVTRQYQREQRTQQRISQIEMRISSMQSKVVTLKIKLSQLYSR